MLGGVAFVTWQLDLLDTLTRGSWSIGKLGAYAAAAAAFLTSLATLWSVTRGRHGGCSPPQPEGRAPTSTTLAIP